MNPALVGSVSAPSPADRRETEATRDQTPEEVQFKSPERELGFATGAAKDSHLIVDKSGDTTLATNDASASPSQAKEIAHTCKLSSAGVHSPPADAGSTAGILSSGIPSQGPMAGFPSVLPNANAAYPNGTGVGAAQFPQMPNYYPLGFLPSMLGGPIAGPMGGMLMPQGVPMHMSHMGVPMIPPHMQVPIKSEDALNNVPDQADGGRNQRSSLTGDLVSNGSTTREHKSEANAPVSPNAMQVQQQMIQMQMQQMQQMQQIGQTQFLGMPMPFQQFMPMPMMMPSNVLSQDSPRNGRSSPASGSKCKKSPNLNLSSASTSGGMNSSLSAPAASKIEPGVGSRDEASENVVKLESSLDKIDGSEENAPESSNAAASPHDSCVNLPTSLRPPDNGKLAALPINAGTSDRSSPEIPDQASKETIAKESSQFAHPQSVDAGIISTGHDSLSLAATTAHTGTNLENASSSQQKLSEKSSVQQTSKSEPCAITDSQMPLIANGLPVMGFQMPMLPQSLQNDKKNESTSPAHGPMTLLQAQMMASGLPNSVNGGVLAMPGLPINGLSMNGMPLNTMPVNGMTLGGVTLNGVPVQGMPLNGMPMPMNMGVTVGANGMALPSMNIPMGMPLSVGADNAGAGARPRTRQQLVIDAREEEERRRMVAELELQEENDYRRRVMLERKLARLAAYNSLRAASTTRAEQQAAAEKKKVEDKLDLLKERQRMLTLEQRASLVADDPLRRIEADYAQQRKEFHAAIEELKVPASKDKFGRWTCGLCDNSATYLYYKHLLRHAANHLNVKPFKCPFCDSRFKRSDTARRHQATCKKLLSILRSKESDLSDDDRRLLARISGKEIDREMRALKRMRMVKERVDAKEDETSPESSMSQVLLSGDETESEGEPEKKRQKTEGDSTLPPVVMPI